MHRLLLPEVFLPNTVLVIMQVRSEQFNLYFQDLHCLFKVISEELVKYQNDYIFSLEMIMYSI